MRASEKELRHLGPLIISGKVDEVQSLMLCIWPPELELDRNDVSFICTVLTGLFNMHGARAHHVYWCFSDRLKRADGDLFWHSTLWTRTQVVADFEGLPNTITWLETLIHAIPPPDVGVAHLALGNLFLHNGQVTSAHTHLQEAVYYSICGVEYYSLDAISSMCTCLTRLGEPRLAFEYARCHAIQSYKLGRIQGEELRKALEGQAAVFGQIDYWIELDSNFADYWRSQKNFSVAAELNSQVGYRLAQLGAIQESIRVLSSAARDATRGSYPSDRPFVITCRHLARFLDPAQLHLEELDQTVSECKSVWLPRNFSDAYSSFSTGTRNGAHESRAVDHLAEIYKAEASARSTRKDHGESLNLVQIYALVGRYCHDQGDVNTSVRIWRDIVNSPNDTSAIFGFVRESLAGLLLEIGRPEESLSISRARLALSKMLAHERCTYHAIASRSLMALKRKREALEEATSALSDWARVLDGLYIEGHKSAWLQRGEPILRCAINAIAEPVPWLDEEKRRRELFRLTELGKARILTDMVARQGYELGAFSLTKGQKLDILEYAAFHAKDWYVPLVIQSVSLLDSMDLVVHGEQGGYQLTPQDIRPIKYAVRLPVSPERRLVTAAHSLGFEVTDSPKDDAVDRDIREFFSRSGGPYGS